MKPAEVSSHNSLSAQIWFMGIRDLASRSPVRDDKIMFWERVELPVLMAGGKDVLSHNEKHAEPLTENSLTVSRCSADGS